MVEYFFQLKSTSIIIATARPLRRGACEKKKINVRTPLIQALTNRPNFYPDVNQSARFVSRHWEQFAAWSLEPEAAHLRWLESAVMHWSLDGYGVSE